jgi:DNA repair photolyase
LLDSEDSFGITLTGIKEPLAAYQEERIDTLRDAALMGVKTWVSFEPVISIYEVLRHIRHLPHYAGKDTLLKIGKLNHYKSEINWKAFGNEAERICKEKGWNYYIKEDLRDEMNR